MESGSWSGSDFSSSSSEEFFGSSIFSSDESSESDDDDDDDDDDSDEYYDDDNYDDYEDEDWYDNEDYDVEEIYDRGSMQGNAITSNVIGDGRLSYGSEFGIGNGYRNDYRNRDRFGYRNGYGNQDRFGYRKESVIVIDTITIATSMVMKGSEIEMVFSMAWNVMALVSEMFLMALKIAILMK